MHENSLLTRSHSLSAINHILKSFFGLGSGGLQIKITLNGTPDSHPNNIVYLRHRPSWKVRKNVFTVLKNHSNTADNAQQRGIVPNNKNNVSNRIMVYSCDHDTEGSITLTMGHGKKLDHLGIQVKFFGRIDMVSLCFNADCWLSSTVWLSLWHCLDECNRFSDEIMITCSHLVCYCIFLAIKLTNPRNNNNDRKGEYTKADHTTTSSPSPKNSSPQAHSTTLAPSHSTFVELKRFMKRTMDGMSQ